MFLYIPVSRYERCVLLADVVSSLGLSRHKFSSTHSDVITHRISWSDFESQTMIADFKSIRRRVDEMHTNDDHRDDHRDHHRDEHRDHDRDEHRDANIDTMSGSDFSDEDSIEVVVASVDLFAVLGIEVFPVKVNSALGYRTVG